MRKKHKARAARAGARARTTARETSERATVENRSDNALAQGLQWPWPIMKTVRCEVLGDIALGAMAGQGGMGKVWLGDASGRAVAVKIVAPHLTHFGEARERFAREIDALARVESPRVAKLLGRGTTACGLPFFVMEQIAGESLAALLERRGPLTPHETGRILAHLFEALAATHAAGAVHRDVKPGNVMVSRAGERSELEATLVDFGVAKTAWRARITLDAHTLGTLRYMSPELLFGASSATASCDLWAAAAVAYECLTGAAPFDGGSIGAMALALDGGVFVPASRAREELPSELDAFFARAFARSEAERFGSAEEMAAAFKLAIAACGALAMREVASPSERRSAPTVRPPAQSGTRLRGGAGEYRVVARRARRAR